MKDSRFTQSLSIILLGLIITVIAFVTLGYAEGLYHNLNQIRWLPLIDTEDVELADGMAKISGKPEVMALLRAEGADENLLFYKKVYEEKIDDQWTRVRIDKTVLDFKIGDYVVHPVQALKFFDLEEISVNETETTRQSVYGVPADEKLIVVGRIDDNVMEGGEIFAISNYSNEVLESELKNLIHSDWWILRLIAWGLLTFGVIAFILPIMQLLEILPELGPIVILLLSGAAILMGFLIVALSTLIFAYWYLIFILLIFVLYLLYKILFYRSRKKHIDIIP